MCQGSWPGGARGISPYGSVVNVSGGRVVLGVCRLNVNLRTPAVPPTRTRTFVAPAPRTLRVRGERQNNGTRTLNLAKRCRVSFASLVSEAWLCPHKEICSSTGCTVLFCASFSRVHSGTQTEVVRSVRCARGTRAQRPYAELERALYRGNFARKGGTGNASATSLLKEPFSLNER